MPCSGPVIVAGAAWCLHDDLAAARRLYGASTPIIAINGAAREVRAFALYSGHPERFVSHRWIYHQKRLFGPLFSVHSGLSTSAGPFPQAAEEARQRAPHVDHWWSGTGRARGTSAWAARKMASLMGFDLTIFCGCPIEVGPYVGHRLGHDLMMKAEVIGEYQQIIASEVEWHKGAVSMSGWTREMLGSP